MYSFPSTSRIFAPCACSAKKGSAPTLRNARTGEFTPPGMYFCATAKSSDEQEVIKMRKKTSNIEHPTSNAEFHLPLLHYSTTPSCSHRRHVDTCRTRPIISL